MELLNALLPNDYFIKTEYLVHINCVYINYYMEHMLKLLNLNTKEIKPRTIIERIYDNIGDKIKKFYLNTKTIIEDEDDPPFSLLFDEELDGGDFSLISNEVITTVNDFYHRYLGYQELVVNKDNVKDLLEDPINIEENKNLIEIYNNCYNKFIDRINLDIIQNVIKNFSNNIINMNDNDKKYLNKGWEHVKFKLFIFLKVLGIDFLKLMYEPLSPYDPFCIVFLKYNKIYISDLRFKLFNYYEEYKNNILLDNINNYDACFLLFVFCRNNDCKGNFIENFIQRFSQRINNYVNRSIKYNSLYKEE